MTDVEYAAIIAEMRQLAADEPDRDSPAGLRLDELAAEAQAFETSGDSAEDDCDAR